MNYPTLKALFDDYGKDLKIDPALLRRVIDFNQRMLTKNADHITFFGGMLVGTVRLTVNKMDFNYWFDEVVDMDQLGIGYDIKKVKGVNTDLVISTEAFNNTCLYVVYRALTDKRASNQLKRDIAYQTLIAMHLRFMCQLQWKYFRHIADKQVAQSALNSLNNRYDLKVYGSWYETIKARCNGFLDPKWKHHKSFHQFDNPDLVREMINRLKSGIEQIFKKQSSIFYDHHKEELKVMSMGAMFTGEEGKELKPLHSSSADARRYLLGTMTSTTNFVKPKLTNVVESLLTVHRDTFLDGLKFICDNAVHDVKIEKWVEDVLVHANEHLNRQKVDGKNILMVMQSLKNVYTSSMANNRLLNDNKAQLDRWLKKIVHRRLHKNIPNARTGIMLYLILRVMTREYYE